MTDRQTHALASPCARSDATMDRSFARDVRDGILHMRSLLTVNK